MHLLTGMLVGELLLGGTLLKGRKKKSPPFDIKHVLPGRVRLAVPLLLGDALATEALVAALGKLEGVHSATGDARTGSLLVRFADSDVARHEIIGLVNAYVQRNQPTEDAEDTPAEDTGTPILRQRILELGRQVNTAVKQETHNVVDLHTLLGVGIGAWGLKTLLAPGAGSRLPGLTWMYWSYNLLRQPMPPAAPIHAPQNKDAS